MPNVMEFEIVSYKPDPETLEHIRIKNGGMFLTDRRGQALRFGNKYDAYRHISLLVKNHNRKFVAKIGARVIMPNGEIYTTGAVDGQLA